MSQSTGAVTLPITQVTNVVIPSNDVVANIAGTLAGASISTVLDNAIGSNQDGLLYRGPNGWAGLVLSGDFLITSGTLRTTAASVTPGLNQYVFSNGAGTIAGVIASGSIDLIFNTGASVAAQVYVLATALPYPVKWTHAKTWVSGTSPSAALNVQTIHNGITSSIGGLGALVVTSGTPSAPVSTATATPNTNGAGDAVQVAIDNLSGTITALGLHLDFVRLG